MIDSNRAQRHVRRRNTAAGAKAARSACQYRRNNNENHTFEIRVARWIRQVIVRDAISVSCGMNFTIIHDIYVYIYTHI